MTKWIPGLLLAAALSSHSVAAKESRGTSTTSAAKSPAMTPDSSAAKTTPHHSRFSQDDAREALKKGKVMPLTAILVLPVWGGIGLLVYFFYSRRRSHVGRGLIDKPDDANRSIIQP